MGSLVSSHGAVMANAWDLVGFFNNSKNYVVTAGGAFLMLIGTAAVVWGGWLIIKKLWSTQPGGGESWGKIIGLVIIGGGLMIGGFTLMRTVASGGQKTITDLGGSSIDFSSLLGLFF